MLKAHKRQTLHKVYIQGKSQLNLIWELDT